MLSENFVEALLDPQKPVPVEIKGQPEKRFAVYRNNVIVGLTNALASNFPVVEKLLGKVYFTGLAAEYARLHPPHSRLMFEFGEKFPAFLAEQNDLASYPYLHNVAQAEILMRRAYHAAEADVLSAIFFANLNPEELGDLRFEAHPSLSLMSSNFAVGSILRHNLFDEVMSGAFDVAENTVISRVDNVVHINVVNAPTFKLITHLVDGKMLAEAADIAFEVDETFDLGAALAFILSQSIFKSIHSSELPK